MIFSELCQQALVNLAAQRLRSLLAVLGILIGSAAIIAELSCELLAAEKSYAHFKALGTDLLSINIFQKGEEKTSLREPIDLLFWQNLAKTTPNITQLAPYLSVYPNLSFEAEEVQAVVIGADERLARLAKINLAKGRFVSSFDVFEHYCVIGAALADELKQKSIESPIGKNLRIGELLFTIIGVAKPWHENGFFNEDINHALIIPISSLALISKTNSLNMAMLQFKPGTSVEGLIQIISSYLSKLEPSLSVFIRSAKQIIDNLQAQSQIFNGLFIIIGLVSLLTGGIGIMNIMLVSVSERKKEIGLRKAVGATNLDIQNLFLTESVLLTLVGGLLGLSLGLIITKFMAYFFAWPFHIYFFPVSLSFIASLSIGIFFGLYPAIRAAKLPAIAALRYD